MELRKYLSNKSSKLLLGTVFLIGMGVSSLTVVFAEQDLSTLMNQWFNQKKIEAVDSIETTVGDEKDKQMLRLKEQLRIEMQRADEELVSYTNAQIEQSVAKLRSHTDQLIASISIEHTAEKQAAINHLNEIYNAAVLEMGGVDLVEIPPVEEVEPPSEGTDLQVSSGSGVEVPLGEVDGENQGTDLP